MQHASIVNERPHCNATQPQETATQRNATQRNATQRNATQPPAEHCESSLTLPAVAKIKHAEIYHAKKKERENFPIYGSYNKVQYI